MSRLWLDAREPKSKLCSKSYNLRVREISKKLLTKSEHSLQLPNSIYLNLRNINSLIQTVCQANELATHFTYFHREL